MRLLAPWPAMSHATVIAAATVSARASAWCGICRNDRSAARRRRPAGRPPRRASPARASPMSIANVASLSPAPFRCATRLPPRSCSSRASIASGLPRPATTIRLTGKLGRADDRQQLVLLAVEARRRGNRPGDRAAGRLVEPAGPGRSAPGPPTRRPRRRPIGAARIRRNRSSSDDPAQAKPSWRDRRPTPRVQCRDNGAG